MIKKRQLTPIIISITALWGCQLTTETDTSSTTSLPYNTTTISPSTVTEARPSVGEVKLSMEQIMSDPDWIGRQPQNAFFSPLGDAMLYYRKRDGSVVRDLYKTAPRMGNGSLVNLANIHEYANSERIDDNDHNFVAWIYQGNIFAQMRDTKEIKQLLRTSDKIENIAYLGSDSISFKNGNSFYSVNINTGGMSELFSWSFAEKPIAVKPAKDYIEQEQHKLIKYIQVQRKNRQDRSDYKTQLEQANNSLMSARFYFDKSHRTVLATISPDGKHAIVVTQPDVPSRDDTDIMPDYIQEDGRIAAKSVRQRVADAKPYSHTVHFIDLEMQTQKELSMVNLPGYNEDVLADVKRENAEARGETYTNNRLPRDIRLLSGSYATEMPIKWQDSGQYAALMLEAWDNKDRWIVTVDVNSPKLTTQHRLHDKAWINYHFNRFGWFDEANTLFLLSEESGYSHLYTKPVDGELTQLTDGRFVVDSVVLTKDDSYFYYKANKKHPGINEIYRIKSQGGESEALTDLNGMTDFVLSPAEDRLLLTHSKLTMPPELYSKNITSNENASRLTNTVSDAFLSIDWSVPAIVPIKSSHVEQPIYSRVYTPKESTSEPRKAVVFTHGAGYLQNAHLGWSAYFREFMFHSLLVSEGYVVLDMDYRASKGYGRDWRTAIYRQMGTPEVEDLVDGVNWLVENANVDRNRIGTYGGSYGGFLTFMSLFNEPDLFQAGAAIRPVSDWAHYNFPYTSNILNTPDVDPIAYERSSPIYFAEGLTKPLLINAPMIDDNVFFVDVVRLVQRLIELEIVSFETAIYPVEPHGFVQPSSWLDEYRRIHMLFEENL